MDTLKLGQIITTEQQRDATHIAVAPVVANERLSPGEHIGLLEDGTAGVEGQHIGIVDPFLRKSVKRGETFWMFLYPGSITSLRHDWSHPAFEKKEPSIVVPINNISSREWIRDFAERLGLSYDEIMDAANGYIKYGSYLCEGGRFQSEDVPDEFWEHYGKITGNTGGSGSFFSCSC